jgi:lysyl-tRNA synthetase class 2
MVPRNEDPFERRKLKLSKLRARGVDPYPPRSSFTNSPRIPIASLIEEFCSYEAKKRLNPGVVMRGSGGFAVKLRVSGRVMGVRDLGGVAFVDIRDGTGTIQLYLQKNYPSRHEPAIDSPERLRFQKPLQILRQQIDIGDFVDVVGQVFRTRRGQISLKARGMKLLSKTLRPLPEKWHGLRDVETRLRQRYLDLIEVKL